MIARLRFQIRLVCALSCLVGTIPGIVWGASLEGGVKWQEEEGYAWAKLRDAGRGGEGFKLLSVRSTGLSFTNTLPERRHLTNQILLNGAGVAAGDVDGDGWCDIYLCCSDGENALFRNLGGWKFERVVGAGGAGCAGLTSTGATLLDLDGDGDLDLVVNTLGNGTRVLVNDGSGRFSPAGGELNAGAGGMTTAAADFDGDGDLDLYISNYRTSGLMDIPNARATFARVDGRMVMESLNGVSTTDPALTNRFVVGERGDIQELGEPDLLLRNEGGMRFLPVSFTGGAFLDEAGEVLREVPRDWGLCAAFRDLNGDGLPDLYVCNDFQTEDRLWVNRGGGRFQAVGALGLRHTSRFSMAVDFSDINRDGRDDFLVLDMLSREHEQRMRYQPDVPPSHEVLLEVGSRPQVEHNVLQVQREDFTFAEVAQLAGVEAGDWAWSCAFMDVDLDGYEDVLVANGMERAARDLDVAERMKSMRASRRMSDEAIFQARLMFPRLATPNLLFRNRGDLSFEEVGEDWGFGEEGVSQGIALADLDGDGDLDVVLNNLNGEAGLYRNEVARPRIALKLEGRGGNTAGVGARVTVVVPGLPVQSDEVSGGGRYLSGDEGLRCFAMGDGGEVAVIRVRWPSGVESVVEGAVAGRVYRISEPSSGEVAREAVDGAVEAVWFEDESALLGHRHEDLWFDDFVRQPLLPRRLSGMGPGVVWSDVDGDGWVDLVMGAGQGGRLAVFRNDGRGGFVPEAGGEWNPVQGRDILGMVAVSGGGGAGVLAALSNYEDGEVAGAALIGVGVGGGEPVELVKAGGVSFGAVALADVNGDGVLDLFLGGRVVAGQYPGAVGSRLFLGDGSGGWREVTEQWLPGVLGMVQGVTFTDVEGDGDPDLVLACDWGALRLLVNEGGRLRDATDDWGLGGLTGFWNSVVTADFDGDGRLDLAAGNWGRNTKDERFRGEPLRLYYADLEGDGFYELVEAHKDSLSGSWVPDRRMNSLAGELPYLAETFRTHRAFSRAELQDVLGEFEGDFREVSAAVLESVVLLNRGGRYEMRALPLEAQVAPVFGLAAGDVNGDGVVDLFCAQNFFGVQPELSRNDAGRGVWLQGDDEGGFRVVSGSESGVRLYGEGRGAALADYDGDGRLDLAVGQNGATTGLFRNVGGRSGLRVKLSAGAGNPDAVGATVWLKTEAGLGPAHYWTAGSGYYSQDGAVRVLSATGRVTGVEVRWMDGRVQSYPVSEGMREVQIEAGSAKR